MAKFKGNVEEKYPIYYAAMPIIEKNGWYHSLHYLAPNYNITGYIVSKCFVVNLDVEYKKFIDKKVFFKLVFPYQIRNYLDEFRELEREMPTFNLNNSECTNFESVEHLFTDYESCKREVENKNNKLLEKSKKWKDKDIDTQDEIEAIHKERMERYQKLEHQINNATLYMNIKTDDIVEKLREHTFVNVTPLDTLIDRILENPKEFYEKIACDLPVEERDYIISLIENKSCGNCTNSYCSANCNEKDRYITSCIAWDNKELIGQYRVLKR